MGKNFNLLLLEIGLIGTAIVSCLSDHSALYMVFPQMQGEMHTDMIISYIPLVCCFIALAVPVARLLTDYFKRKDGTEIVQRETTDSDKGQQ